MERHGKNKLMIGSDVGLWSICREDRQGWTWCWKGDQKGQKKDHAVRGKDGPGLCKDKRSELSYSVLSWRFSLLGPTGTMNIHPDPSTTTQVLWHVISVRMPKLYSTVLYYFKKKKVVRWNSHNRKPVHSSEWFSGV